MHEKMRTVKLNAGKGRTVASEPRASAGISVGEEHSVDTWSSVHSGEVLLLGWHQRSHAPQMWAWSPGRRWLRVCWVPFEMAGCNSEALWVIHLKAEVHLWRVVICVGSVGAVSVGDKSK